MKRLRRSVSQHNRKPVAGTRPPFDPTHQQSTSPTVPRPTTNRPAHPCAQEFRKGFAMGERLLRPAMVQVSFTDKPAEVPAAETQEEEEKEEKPQAEGEQAS